MSQKRKPYRTEMVLSLKSQLSSRLADIAKVGDMKGRDGKPRHHKDVARIKRAIQLDAAYLQRDVEAFSDDSTGLTYVPARQEWFESDNNGPCYPVRVPPMHARVGFPCGKVLFLPPFHEAVTLWRDGKRLV